MSEPAASRHPDPSPGGDGSAPPIRALDDLGGKVAFVTGATHGIGLACARRLAEAGAAVCGFDLDPGDGGLLARAVGDPDRARLVQGDVASRDDVDAAVSETLSAWGRIDVVVNSAGLFPPAPALEITEDLWDHVIGVNATGTFVVSQACARAMRETGGGAIVNLASKSAFQPTAGFAHYAASKGAVVMITKAMALELAPLGIRVNAVAPGSVATDTAARMGAAAVAQEGDAVMARSGRCPMGRSATPDEIARVVLFLASDWSSFLTGSVVVADGGFLVS